MLRAELEGCYFLSVGSLSDSVTAASTSGEKHAKVEDDDRSGFFERPDIEMCI
jgi:hypothetical protein